MSNGTNTAAESSSSASEMDSCPEHLSGRWTSESLTPELLTDTEAWLMSLPQDSRASRSALPACDGARRTSATCGPQPSSAFAWYDRAESVWRTRQASFAHPTGEPLLGTWPESAVACGGAAYLLPIWGLSTYDDDSGLLPTPVAGDANVAGANQHTRTFGRWFRNTLGSGKYSMDCAEWMMGLPIGWTDVQPLETCRFRSWLQRHGVCSEESEC